jgi:hypothetical protein
LTHRGVEGAALRGYVTEEPRRPTLVSMLSPPRLPAALAVALATLGALPGCGGAQLQGPADAVVLADLDTRLHGTWRFLGFRSATPLDVMAQAFIAFQNNNLTVRLSRGRMIAESPGVHLDRAYRLHDAAGEQFKITSFDEQGVPYEAGCTFTRPDLLEVSSWTDPWRGVATFQKESGPGPLPAVP